MGINNEGTVNRRQLLVRAGSLMKMSWRKSKEELFDYNEDEGNENSNLRKSGRNKKRNLSVRVSDDLHEEPIIYNEPLSDKEIANKWYQVCFSWRTSLWRGLGYIIFFNQLNITLWDRCCYVISL